ncbi:MAG: SspB family protein [Caulobacteraceae bacterium]
MAKDDKPKDLMGYEALQQDALRGVVRSALAKAASPRGLPGDHHFYISFRTGAAGVSGPADLLGRYPEEMTIVLQNQYWDLKPGEADFSVTLQFGGQPKNLSIPYAAVTRFYDPSVQYLLQFGPVESAPAPPALAPTSARPVAVPAGGDEPKIVSLDQFRKK